MKNLVSRDLARWLRRRIQLTGVSAAALSLVSASVTGCGGSPSEVSGIASPTVEAGIIESTVPVMPTPAAPPPAPVAPAATPTPTIPPPTPTVPPPTPTIPPPTSTAVPVTSGFVLEHPNIPREIEERILEYRYSPLDIPRADEASEIQTYVKKIKCEEDVSIAYVQNLITQVNSNEAGDQNDATVESIGQHSWRIPWKNGHLHLGYPKPIDPCMVEVQGASEETTVWWFPSLHGEPYLLMRASDDGNDWTSPERFSVPFTVSPLRAYGEEVFSPQILVASNGNRLLLVIEEASTVKAFVTTDLDVWDQSTSQFQRPEYLHPKIGIWFGLEDVVLGPNGWLVRAIGSMSPDPYLMAPDDIRSEAVYITYDNSAICPIGIELQWYTVDSTYETLDSRCMTWDELGIDYNTFWYYASFLGNKPYAQSENFSGWVWSQEWEFVASSGDSKTWVELPYIGAKRCCDIIGTTAGYLALTEPYLAGYNPLWSGPQEMFFSRDGYEWESIETPESTHMEDRREQGDSSFTFIWSIHNLGDAILVSGHWYSDHPDYALGDPAMWIIDADGTNWREADPTEYADFVFSAW